MVKNSFSGQALAQAAQGRRFNIQIGCDVLQGNALEYFRELVDEFEVTFLRGQAFYLDKPAHEAVVVPEHFLLVPVPDLRKAGLQGQEIRMRDAQEFTVFHRLDVQLGGLGRIEAFQVAYPPILECEIEYMLATVVIRCIGAGTTFVDVRMQSADLSGPQQEMFPGEIFPFEVRLHENILLFPQPDGPDEEVGEGGRWFEAMRMHFRVLKAVGAFKVRNWR